MLSAATVAELPDEQVVGGGALVAVELGALAVV